MKKNVLCLALLLVSLITVSRTEAQEMKYYDAGMFTMVGKGLETERMYHRVDTVRYGFLEPTLKRLLTNSVGLAIAFKTDSRVISARWEVKERASGDNMTAILHRGLDLYIRRDGVWQFAGVGRPGAGYKCEYTIIKSMEEGEKECLLYLPAFSELLSLEIGVEQDAGIAPSPQPFRKKIVVYGSSIVHGASASRPGLAYPAQMCRFSGLDFINIGLSGNAKMQPGMERILSDMAPDAFVLDCMPNCSPELIAERTVPFVKYLRDNNPGVPIVFIQTVRRETGNFNMEIRAYEEAKRREVRKAVEVLREYGITGFYFIDGEDFIGNDHEGTADGTHPTDVGFSRMLEKIYPIVMDALRENGIYTASADCNGM